MTSSFVLALVVVLSAASVKSWTVLPEVQLKSWTVLPMVTAWTGVKFYRHTSDAGRHRIISLETVPMLDSRNITVIVHGGFETHNTEWVKELSNAILSQENESNHMVFIVDYLELMLLLPFRKFEIAKYVAKETAVMLNYLVLHNQLDLSRCHWIGFSFGAMIGGMVSPFIQKGKMGRLTGLDPSLPYKIPDYEDSLFIDESDAEIVLTIRTSPLSRSSKIPQTPIDFYVDGGIVQPGCDKWYTPGYVDTVCSHIRAPWLLVEAYEQSNSASFEACSCDDYDSFVSKKCSCKIKNNFGPSINPRLTGEFYLTTNDEPPYSVIIS